MIAVTGAEFVCPRGDGLAAFCEGSLLDAALPRDLESYNAGARLPTRNLKFVSAAGRLFCSTALAALEHSGAQALVTADPRRVGIYHGTENSQLDDVFRFDICTKVEGPESVSPMDAPNTLANVAAGELAIRLGVTGPTVTVTCGASSASQALQLGAWQLQKNALDVAIVGAVEVSSAYHRALWSRSPEAEAVPRSPELGAAFVLESAAAARARGATPLALLLGGAPARLGALDGDAARTIADGVLSAAKDAGIGVDAVDLILMGGGAPPVDSRLIDVRLREAGQRAASDYAWLDTHTGRTEDAAGALGLMACLGLFQGMLAPERVRMEAVGGEQPVRGARPRVVAVCVSDAHGVASCLLLGAAEATQ